jgi:hypothetical protein
MGGIKEGQEGIKACSAFGTGLFFYIFAGQCLIHIMENSRAVVLQFGSAGQAPPYNYDCARINWNAYHQQS